MDIPQKIYELLPNLHEGIYVVDANRKITFWNEGAERITGYSSDEVTNQYCYTNILQHIDEHGKKLCFGGCPLHKTLKQNKVLSADVYLHHKDGHRVHVFVKTIPIVEEGEIVGAVEAFTDQSFQENFYKQNQELLSKIAYDHLLKIFNREYIDLHIKQYIEKSNVFSQSFGLLFVDVDNFKKVNDTYGHLIGDEVLKLIAKTLSLNLRANDVIGRWGGDELIILLDVQDHQMLSQVANKLRTLVEHSSFEKIYPTVTIGGTLFSENDNREIMMDRADKALYQAKSNGRNQVVIK